MTEKWVKENADFCKLNNMDCLIVLQNNKDIVMEFYRYSVMFKESASLLTKHIIEKENTSKLDSYFFSLTFLYRHSLELLLKAIGFKYMDDLEDRKDFIKQTFHNLSLLLKEIYPFLEHNTDVNHEATQWLEELFEDMNDIDKESDSFRYPFGIIIKRGFDGQKNYGLKSFFNKQTHINLVTLANKMEIAFDLLESILLEKEIKNQGFREYKPVFLEEGGLYYSQSVIGYSYNQEKFHPYIKAYIESADYLSDLIIEDKKMDEKLFIPMCYLYRNGIELALKGILFEESSYNFEQALELMKDKKHSILGLWNLIKSDIIKHARASKEDTTLAQAEKYIVQLHNIDGNSSKFRYPIDKYINLYFKTPKKFDIENVVLYFSELATFLRSVCMMMSAHNEGLAEMEAEYRDNMENLY